VILEALTRETEEPEADGFTVLPDSIENTLADKMRNEGHRQESVYVAENEDAEEVGSVRVDANDRDGQTGLVMDVIQEALTRGTEAPVLSKWVRRFHR
jgi:predicted N-acetyltransferase YhbS